MVGSWAKRRYGIHGILTQQGVSVGSVDQDSLVVGAPKRQEHYAIPTECRLG